MLRAHRGKREPYFLYFAYTARISRYKPARPTLRDRTHP